MAEFADDFSYDGLKKYLAALEKWFFAQQFAAYHRAILPDGKMRLCLGVLVFGDYVDRFLRYGIPSLQAPGNLDALFEPRIIIHTDSASVDRIARAMAALPDHVSVDIYVVPDELIAQVGDHGGNKYWMLGTVCNLHMQQAKYLGHGYHMLMPDHVYACGYFANLARMAQQGERAIVQGAMSGRMEEVGPVLESTNGMIDPKHLNALVLDHLHPQLDPFLMSGDRVDYPVSLLLLMVGHDRAHIISPHMTIIYLAHEVLMRAPLRLFNTTDAQLPFFIPENINPYVPNADDGMSYTELSDMSKPPHKQGPVSLIEFCVRFWVQSYCCRGFERFFGLTTVMAFPDGYRPTLPVMTNDEIESMKMLVRSAVAHAFQEVHDLVPDELRIDPILRANRRLAEQKAA